MALDEAEVPETHVLAIASHVGAPLITTLGCEVSAIHTVNYSNHVAYKTFSGSKTSPEQVADLYKGLKSARLDNFDMMLSGYCPSASLVHEVGKIARDAKFRSNTKPGSFFWILDPVMGDNGRIYVAEECVDAYKALLKDADLILPNQFEAELLSGMKITDKGSLVECMGELHRRFGLPHVVVTSMKILGTTGEEVGEGAESKLSVVGSTATSQGKPRLFTISVPAFPIFFSGTGDMFAALLVVRLRQAAMSAGLSNEPSWVSPDDVKGPDLPLAKATEKVLASMHAVLKDTAEHYEKVKGQMEGETELSEGTGVEAEKDRVMERHLRLTRAAEVRVVRNTKSLREPPDLESFRAKALES